MGRGGFTETVGNRREMGGSGSGGGRGYNTNAGDEALARRQAAEDRDSALRASAFEMSTRRQEVQTEATNNARTGRAADALLQQQRPGNQIDTNPMRQGAFTSYGYGNPVEEDIRRFNANLDFQNRSATTGDRQFNANLGQRGKEFDGNLALGNRTLDVNAATEKDRTQASRDIAFNRTATDLDLGRLSSKTSVDVANIGARSGENIARTNAYGNLLGQSISNSQNVARYNPGAGSYWR